MTHDSEERRESGRKGGQASKKHSVYAVQARGEAAMTEEQKGTFLEIEQGLETPEGIVLAMRKRVAMSLMVLGVLESYLEERVNAGVSPEAIDIFKSWPAFQNSAMRALAQLLATMPKPQHDALADEVEKIKALVRDAERAQEVQVGDDQDSDTDAPGQAQGSGEGESD